jgi:hypothetical protein
MTTASRSSAASSLRQSVEIDQVEDQNYHIRDISPSNASLLVESSDGSDDNEVVGRTRSRSSSIININDDSSETDEDKHGMTLESISNHLLTIH